MNPVFYVNEQCPVCLRIVPGNLWGAHQRSHAPPGTPLDLDTGEPWVHWHTPDEACDEACPEWKGS